ncbi:MAG: response regulator [Spirulina sp. SIO3F2]|nr:response regulator [Spirulina sp. SIO3F2]
MNVEEALDAIAVLLANKTGKQLTGLEQQILQAAWQGDTYSALAESLYISQGHIRDIAARLWKLLSEVFGEHITKNNLRSLVEAALQSSEVILPTTTPPKPISVFNHTEADDEAAEAIPNGNILIVDDHADNLRLLTALLLELGYQVRTANSGKLALRTVKNNPPDLILLDILMPEMDGYEVCATLKSEEESAEIPVIFLSALNEVLDKVRAFEVGGVDYISKPFEREEVIARINNQLTLQQQKRQLHIQIEQLRQTEETLYQSRAFLANVLNRSLDGIAILQAMHDPFMGEVEDFSWLMVNPCFATIFNKKRAEMVGKRKIKPLLEAFSPGLFQQLVEVLETREPLTQEIAVQTPAGQKWYQLIAVTLGDGVSLTVRDITELSSNQRAQSKSV